MKICCYGICKNEKKFLQRCFDSIKDADYFAFLDTGSTDGTYEMLQELAKENPGKYFVAQEEFKPWRFDTARNASMKLIPTDTDVCISVDIDDVFPENWREIVEKDIEAGYNKIICRYQYYNEDGTQKGGQTLLDRISKFGEAHWENGIHERLVIENENAIDEPNFIVAHKQDLEKERRQIYLEAAEASADTDYGKLCLGYEYHNVGEYQKSAEIFEKLYEKLKDSNSEYITRKMLLMLADVYGLLQDYEKEANTLNKVLSINNQSSRFEDSINYDETFINKRVGEANKINEEFKYYFELAKNYFNQKDYLAAVSCIDICKAKCKLKSILNIRTQYKNAYLNSIKTRKYETNKVAVYAICKNERAFVERWYESMKEADYICVLDTGSDDGTFEALIELSKKDPKVIINQHRFNPWRFDIPRNFAMDLIPEDANILLSTDLDEILEPGWGDDLRNNWIDGKYERASYQYAWSHTASGGNGRVFWYNKVHTWNWIWRHPVHELLYSLVTETEGYEPEQSVSLYTMFLHHYADPTKSRGNYLPLLEQRAQEDEDDFYGLVYLTHEYNYRGRYQDSIDLLEKLLMRHDFENDALLKACCYLFMGEDYGCLGKQNQAISCYLQSIDADPTYREGYLNLAQVYLDQQKYEKAVYYVKQGLANSVRHYSWLERDNSWTFQPYDLLSLAYYYSGDKIRSYAAAIWAAKLEPADKRLQDNVRLIKENITEKDWSL